jgi:hypothetical protein
MPAFLCMPDRSHGRRHALLSTCAHSAALFISCLHDAWPDRWAAVSKQTHLQLSASLTQPTAGGGVQRAQPSGRPHLCPLQGHGDQRRVPPGWPPAGCWRCGRRGAGAAQLGGSPCPQGTARSICRQVLGAATSAYCEALLAPGVGSRADVHSCVARSCDWSTSRVVHGAQWQSEKSDVVQMWGIEGA